ncbi:hypothetical protein DFH09DRAFT_1094444 [Mycena vulgaris]|nr:hypothetical protein DFH09DRAFT_1094444 [Mycena vulgaris]
MSVPASVLPRGLLAVGPPPAPDAMHLGTPQTGLELDGRVLPISQRISTFNPRAAPPRPRHAASLRLVQVISVTSVYSRASLAGFFPISSRVLALILTLSATPHLTRVFERRRPFIGAIRRNSGQIHFHSGSSDGIACRHGIPRRFFSLGWIHHRLGSSCGNGGGNLRSARGGAVQRRTVEPDADAGDAAAEADPDPALLADALADGTVPFATQAVRSWMERDADGAGEVEILRWLSACMLRGIVCSVFQTARSEYEVFGLFGAYLLGNVFDGNGVRAIVVPYRLTPVPTFFVEHQIISHNLQLRIMKLEIEGGAGERGAVERNTSAAPAGPRQESRFWAASRVRGPRSSKYIQYTAFRRHPNSVRLDGFSCVQVSADDQTGPFYMPKQRSVEHIAHLHESVPSDTWTDLDRSNQA